MNLAQASTQFKIVIKWLGLSLVLLAFIWAIWWLLVFSFRLFFPLPPPGPDTIFGSLTKPFTNNFQVNRAIFDLEIPGGLPTVPNFLPVYAVPAQTGDLNTLNAAKLKAKRAGLDSEPIKISDSIWRWTNNKNTNRTLDLDIVYNNFTYRYNWIADATALNGVFKTTDDQTLRKALSYLQTFSAQTTDLKNGTNRITYWKLVGQNRTQVTSYSDANAVQVEFFRGRVGNKYKVAEPNPNSALVRLLFSPSSSGEKELLEFDYIFWNVDFNKKGTYPLITSEEAFNELRSGRAFIAVGNQAFDQITLSEFSIQYFNPASFSSFLEPVYVFKGMGTSNSVQQDFLAYVPAISSSYLVN